MLQHKVPVALLGASVVLPIAGMVWAYFALRGINQPLIVHFTEHTGITEVGTLSYVLFLGAFWAFASFVNIAIGIPLLKRDAFLGYFLTGASFCLSILIFIWFAAIIHVN
ncbi:MAG: hypothetical protein HYY10_04210 [Candidatus Liptonbacteria bacterium]|nr:hypothetical protein [Candidatus Liptonbacteria bacterium]